MMNLSLIPFLLGFLSMSFIYPPVFSQSNEKERVQEFLHLRKTSDVLYIKDDNRRYLIDNSPLNNFTGYKTLYDSFKDVADFYQTSIFIIFDITPTYPYYVVWYLNDNKLYLSEINFETVSDYKRTFPGNEQYKLMENLTHQKFNIKYENHTRKHSGKNDNSDIYYLLRNPSETISRTKEKSSVYPLRNPYGAMPATWVNDTIIIKESYDFDDRSVEEWKRIPCRELIFRKGVLISNRLIKLSVIKSDR